VHRPSHPAFPEGCVNSPASQWHVRVFVRTHSGGSVPELRRLPSSGPIQTLAAFEGNRVPAKGTVYLYLIFATL